MSVTRFDISGYDFDFDISGCDFDIAEDTEGEWVRYVDHAAALTAANARIEALTKERDALQSALGRIRPVPERILRGIPVRDLAETLAEADSALSKGESHE